MPQLPPITHTRAGRSKGKTNKQPSFIPALEDLPLPEDCQAYVYGVIAGKLEFDPERGSTRVSLPPLGKPTITELLALYAPWEVIKGGNFLWDIGSTTFNSHRLFGKNGRKIIAPTYLLTFLNPHVEVSDRILTYPHKKPLDAATFGPVGHAIISVDSPLEILQRLLQLNSPKKKAAFYAVIQERLISAVIALAPEAKENNTASQAITRILAPGFGTATWQPSAIAHDPRLHKLYPIIKDCITPHMNAYDAVAQTDVYLKDINLWLQNLAQGFIREKAKTANVTRTQ